MNEREELERQIRELLTADLDCVSLSNRLFQQGVGLFSRLGTTEVDRRELVESELWAMAQARMHELESRDLDRFREVVRTVQQHHPAGGYALRLEPAERPK